MHYISGVSGTSMEVSSGCQGAGSEGEMPDSGHWEHELAREGLSHSLLCSPCSAKGRCVCAGGGGWVSGLRTFKIVSEPVQICPCGSGVSKRKRKKRQHCW